ncbi:MAG TPA: 3-methylitaconate isomerase [Anaerolineae bacterium]|nr:3-methylitaconate isomerase [Anaerolineae bacterium]
MDFYGEQKRIRCVLMRGGTSRGLFIMRNELPADPELRDKVILRMYGSPDVRQIDGVGGADSLTSKLAIIGPPTRPDADVDYTFAQVSITEPFVDYAGNCGNVSAGVGPFAIDEGLVDAVEPVTTVHIHQTNTNCLIVAEVPVVNGKAAVEGDYHIDGVPGTGARIELDFSDTAGAVTGHILPTGNPVDRLDVPGVGPIDVTIVDAGTPCVFVRAVDMGIKGTETPAQIDADRELNDRIERIRGTAATRIGLVEKWQDAARKSPYLPFFVLISPPADYLDFATGRMIEAEQVDFVARLLFMLRMHKAYAVTGTVCTGAAAKIPGTIVYEAARPESRKRALTLIGHPIGVIDIEAAVEIEGDEPKLMRASVGRTARRIMEGYILVPWSTFAHTP